MIYFDNAATGGFKPRAVTEQVETITKYLCANPGRSGHRLSITGAKIVYSCREILADFFGAKSDNVAFTKNCTEALNLAIFGTLKKGGHIITTIYEHNSVLRPLYKLEKDGLITLDVVAPTSEKDILTAIKEKINCDTYLIVTTAVSNVTGEKLPVKEIGKIAKENDILYLVDGAQGGGHIPLSITDDNISMLALAGHKGLYGIMGIGSLIFNENVNISPIIYGGTGTESFSLTQPKTYPERLEAGTLNLPAIGSLNEGVRYIKNNLSNFSEKLIESTSYLIDGLSDIQKVRCYSSPNESGIVSFKIEGLESNAVADLLNQNYDIAVRGGLHCAPLIHRYLKTESSGLIRVSLAVQNTAREINTLLHAVDDICKY
ncbi:MAG: aminotransferase class V-fold PLP-dependent enzyme [Clostridia bacterium]|nr:aminotransferase class V-fold PLP-dependent enzyme [Clostridia bacterium]